jgi:elongator complex protein 1
MRNIWPVVVSETECGSVEACAIGPEFIYILSPSHTLTIFNLKKETTSTKNLASFLNAPVINMTFLQLQDSLSFVLDNGEIVKYDETTHDASVEGEIPAGVSSATWSNSQEILAIISKDSKLCLLTSSFDPIKMIDLPSALRTHITWRGDDKHFHVSLELEDGFLIKSFDASAEENTYVKSDPEGGVVQSVCDRKDLIDSPLVAWQPAGSIVAGVKGKSVVLWEKNGLKHGEFGVDGDEIRGLYWDPSSSILAISTIQNNSHEVLIYRRSNYYWYLKQRFNFSNPVVEVLWEGPEKLAIISTTVFRVTFRVAYNVGATTSVVVDNHKLAFTELSRALIPPPMSSYEIQIPGTPEALAISSADKVAFKVADKLYRIENEEVVCIKEGLDMKVNHILWKEEHTLVLVSGRDIYVLEGDNTQILHATGIVYAVSSRGPALIETLDGSVYSLDNLSKPVIKFHTVCQYIYGLNSSKMNIAGLSGTRLYYNNSLLSNNCISAGCFGDYFLFIKSGSPLSELYLFNIHNPIPFTLREGNQPAVLKEPSSEHFYSRNIESGSNIVLLAGTTLVLQMARGNLTGLCPRLVMIETARRMILECKFKEVFEMLRKNKLDLNLIHDVNPELFVQNIHTFIAQVSKIDYLNLFITNLSDIDTSAKYFLHSPRDFKGKVNQLCDLLRLHLNSTTHLLPIMTTYCKKSPPELQAALIKIQELKSLDQSRPPRPPHLTESSSPKSVSSEDALKYVCWLVDPDKLYNLALGMYDLELVTMVAQHTQKDPKEYLPYLQELSHMDEVDRRYRINLDLKRYDTALEELYKGGEQHYNSCIELIEKHNLYMLGLKLFENNSAKGIVLRSFGNYLKKLGMHTEAGSMYWLAGELEQALDCFIRNSEFDFGSSVARQMGIDINPRFSEEAHKLGEKGDFGKAAVLYKDYLFDPSHAVRSLLQSGNYISACSLAYDDDTRSLVRSTVLTFTNDLIEDIDKNTKLYQEKYSRLKTVQSTKRDHFAKESEVPDEAASEYSADSIYSKASTFMKKQRKRNKKLRKVSAKEGSAYEEEYLVDFLLTLRPDTNYFERVEKIGKALIYVGLINKAHELHMAFEQLKKLTNQRVITLKQQAFLDSFYEHFSEVTRDETTDDSLCDIASKNFFLAEGLASHIQPKLPSSFLGNFFRNLRC